MLSRVLGPRYLCFLDHQAGVPDDEPPYRAQGVSERIREKGGDADTRYLFVSFTRAQFNVPKDPRARVWTRDHDNPHGLQSLIKIAVRAAQAARVPAFWLDFECCPPDEDSADGILTYVYRISDVVRAAHSLAIAVPNHGHNEPDGSNEELTLWGDQVWTIPEALLCSDKHGFTVYSSLQTSCPRILAKRNFAGLAWPSIANDIRELIDHYEATIHLTPLELVSIALKCLLSRNRRKW
jgi:hypothetical protein